MRWVAKTYANKPMVVLGTLEVAFHLTGVDERTPRTYVPSPMAEYLEEALRKLPARSRYDFILPWVAAQLNKYTDDILMNNARTALTERSTAIAQWALANRVDLGRVSAGEAFEAVDKFRIFGPAEPGEVVYRFADGWTLQKLTTRSQLTQEGEIMQHCVGNYCAKVQAGESVIYSLRDPQGHPHVTLEWSPKTRRFVQIRGKQNQPVVEKYRPYVWEVLLKVFDGEAMGLILTGFDFKAHNMRIDLHGADLRHVELGGMNLDDADLSGAYLEYAWLVSTSLVRANLRGADLRLANLRDADLSYADLRGTSFGGSTIENSYLVSTIFTGALMDSHTLLPPSYLKRIRGF